MKKKMLCSFLTVVMCAALAACGAKPNTPVPTPNPAPQTEPAAPAATEPQSESPVAPPDLAPAPAPAPTQAAEPAQPSPQPAEPALPESDETPDDPSANYVGTWRNYRMSNGRCSMEIDCEDGVNYDINIFWGSSSATARYWHFTGTYDETQAGIVYTGLQFYGWTQDDGSIERSEETEDEVGLIRLEDGVLYWEDMTGRVKDEMIFDKES